MHYKNSLLVYEDNLVREIVCDKKVFLNDDFTIGSKDQNCGYLLKIQNQNKVLFKYNDQELILNPYERILSQEEGNDSIVYIENEQNRFFTKDYDEIHIGNSEESHICINNSSLDLLIKKNNLINLSNQKVYLNGKLQVSKEVSLNEGDLIIICDLKFTYYSQSLLIEGNSDLYKCKFMKMDLNNNEFDGFPDYKRSPRIIKNQPEDAVDFKKPPNKETRQKGQLLRTIIPPIVMLIVTIAVSIFMKRGLFVIITITSTCMTLVFSVTSYISQKKESARKNSLRIKVYNKYLLDLRKELNDLRNKQIESLKYHNPSLKEIEKLVVSNNSRIYERTYTDDDFLNIYIGNSNVSPSYKMKMNNDSIELEKDELIEESKKIYEEFALIKNMPITIDLKKAHLGIVGEKKYIHEQLNIIFAQLTLFQSYNDLEIVFIHNEKYREDFSWLRWYPHFKISSINVRGLIDTDRTRDQVLGNLAKILKDRDSKKKDQNEKIKYVPHYLFVIDEPSLIMNHSIMEFLQSYDSDLGFSIIYTSLLKDNLPENIRTIFNIDNYDDGTLIINEGRLLNKKIKLNHVDIELENLSRGLSSLNHIKGMLNQVPDSITFFEMYKVKSPAELNIENRWRGNDAHKTLAVPLGVRGQEDYVYLNLHEKAHGPHGLVAGTTGSGKSEIVQSYILSLAVNFHPYEVGFLLIDYKGGGMAGLFENLPHLLGTITNLDGSESMRAMASIKSELARRQQIFNEYKVNHINQYSKLFKTGKAKEPIPHLFLISDEFAELKKEQPDFMKELVSAARIGRSLGIHLILATQKPSGVVDDQIWSNSKFKLALKVQNESDSNEVLKTPDAAKITQAGRAYLQVGNNEIYELFQSAWSGAVYENKEEDNSIDDRVYIINQMGQGELLNQDLSRNDDDLNLKLTELDVSVKYMNELYNEFNLPKVKRPWLPPLPRKIVSPYINQDNIQDVNIFTELDTNVSIGVIDIPELQAQVEYRLNFVKDGNLLVFSSTGFGKTTTLTTVILSLALKNSPSRLQFYILDFGNAGLIQMKELPHVKDYIKFDDEVKFTKFRKIIDEESKRRKRLLSEASVANFTMYNEVSENKLEAIFIVIDNYDVIKEMNAEAEDFILRVTRDGAGIGIFIIASVSRQNAMKYAVLNNFKNKISHYLFDETELNIVIGRGNYKLPEVVGRALVKTDNVNIMQVYSPIDFKEELEYATKLLKLTRTVNERYSGEELIGIRMLPEALTVSILEQFDKSNNDIKKIPIGLDEESVIPQYIEATGGLRMIVGGQQSGKTNLLKVAIMTCKNMKTYLVDSKNIDLYNYRNNVSKYISSGEELNYLMDEIKETTLNRKAQYEDYRIYNNDIIPKVYYESLEPIVVFIDDCDNFISQATSIGAAVCKGIIEEAIEVGVTFVVTAQSNGLKGYDDLTKIFKGCINGVILGNPNEQTLLQCYVRNAKAVIDIGHIYSKGQVTPIKIPKV